MDPAKLDDVILALLFAAEEPLSTKRMAALLSEVGGGDINQSLERLKERFNLENSSIMLERVAGGYQLSTHPNYAEFVARLYSGRRKQRLSKAGMETLAIIAYKQRITRADIEHVRGVGCGGVITTLMERSLIKIVGKAKVLGAPFLYGTTHEFLEYLGLNTLKDLPSIEELEALLEHEEMARGSEETEDTPAASDAAGDTAPEDEEEMEEGQARSADPFEDDAASVENIEVTTADVTEHDAVDENIDETTAESMLQQDITEDPESGRIHGAPPADDATEDESKKIHIDGQDT